MFVCFLLRVFALFCVLFVSVLLRVFVHVTMCVCFVFDAVVRCVCFVCTFVILGMCAFVVCFRW